MLKSISIPTRSLLLLVSLALLACSGGSDGGSTSDGDAPEFPGVEEDRDAEESDGDSILPDGDADPAEDAEPDAAETEAEPEEEYHGVGAFCLDDPDCDDGLLCEPILGSLVCTKECHGMQTECPDGTECVSGAVEGTTICIDSDSLHKKYTYAECDYNYECPTNLVCLDAPTRRLRLRSICTRPCSADADCPQEGACLSISGMTQSVCQDGGEAHSGWYGDSCAYAWQCDDQLPCTPSLGICTIACSVNEECTILEKEGFCADPGNYLGGTLTSSLSCVPKKLGEDQPLGGACLVNEQCAGGACLHDAITGSYCSALCTDACDDTTFRCLEATAGSAACVKAGAHERAAGESCWDESDCVEGLVCPPESRICAAAR